MKTKTFLFTALAVLAAMVVLHGLSYAVEALRGSGTKEVIKTGDQ